MSHISIVWVFIGIMISFVYAIRAYELSFYAMFLPYNYFLCAARWLKHKIKPHTEKMVAKIQHIRPKIIVVVLMIGIVIAPVWVYLHSIHYKAHMLVNYQLRWGSTNVSGFAPHKQKYEVLVEEVNVFLAGHPNFFEESNGVGFVNSDGLKFYKKGVSTDRIIYQWSDEKWEEIASFTSAFPSRGGGFSHIRISRNYPDCITFNMENAPTTLVYCRNGRPDDLIKRFWEKYEFVSVRKLAIGWYEIDPWQSKGYDPNDPYLYGE
jgi:hypothetical protein